MYSTKEHDNTMKLMHEHTSCILIVFWGDRECISYWSFVPVRADIVKCPP